jgi:uncharacterized protein YbjQ (UPF0145 family)
MRCQFCGAENSEGARFCGTCGANLTNDGSTSVADMMKMPLPGGSIRTDMVTTGLAFEGFHITRYLGVVRGLTVRSRSVVGNFIGQTQALFGGNISAYVDLCEHARAEAYDLMVSHAMQMGANAIIGMRYDANDVMEGITEVLAYGTAVIIEPV